MWEYINVNFFHNKGKMFTLMKTFLNRVGEMFSIEQLIKNMFKIPHK